MNAFFKDLAKHFYTLYSFENNENNQFLLVYISKLQPTRINDSPNFYSVITLFRNPKIHSCVIYSSFYSVIVQYDMLVMFQSLKNAFVAVEFITIIRIDHFFGRCRTALFFGCL